jgi:hypothetical protein
MSLIGLRGGIDDDVARGRIIVLLWTIYTFQSKLYNNGIFIPGPQGVGDALNGKASH